LQSAMNASSYIWIQEFSVLMLIGSIYDSV